MKGDRVLALWLWMAAVAFFGLYGSAAQGGSACSLITNGELKALIGGEMWGPGELLQHGGGISECMFQYGESRVYVRLRTGTSWFDYVKAVDKGEAVAGLGDEAYWYSIAKSLAVRVRGTTLEIQLSFPANGLRTNQKTAAIGLAKKAMPRIKTVKP